MATSFSKLLASIGEESGHVILDIPSDWMQGRSVFGGLQLAFALRAMRHVVGREVILRSLQATFLAPVPAGLTRARAQILRAGKNATLVEARIIDGASTLALVIGVFGAPRSSSVSITPVQPPFEPTQAFDLPHAPGLVPDFARHFKARWLRGLPPFTGDRITDHVLEVGMNDDGTATEEHVVAIADFIPPIALSHLNAPAFGSTITWMLELLVDRLDRFPLDRWRVDAQLFAARDGYTNQSLTLWSPTGTAIALSRQTMLIFG